MGNILDENYQIFLGLYTALSRTRTSAKILYQKILEAQNQYFINLEKGIETHKQKMTIELLDDAMHKFYLGSYFLEQLWGVHHYLEVADHGLPTFYNHDLTNQKNEISFLLSALLDQALYSWRSFIDFYLKYLLYFIIGEYIVTMSLSDFFNIMNNYINKNPENDLAIKIDDYIRTNVFSQRFDEETESWGDLLKSLRDKTTHQKLLRPTLIERPNRRGYIVEWPTIQGQDFSHLVQINFENEAFKMIRELFPLLYGFDWISGPYKEGMYR